MKIIMRKIYLNLILCLLASAAFIASPAQAFVPGDLDGNGSVNVFDAQKETNVILESETNPDIIARADVNGDGARNVLDLTKIANISLGQPTVGIASPAKGTTYTTAQTITNTTSATTPKR